MSTIDHAATALACLNIPGVLVREDDASPAGDRMIQEAQVHATLALVAAQDRATEQARIANLIALARAEDECGLQFSDDTLAAVDPDYPGFALKIGDPS